VGVAVRSAGLDGRQLDGGADLGLLERGADSTDAVKSVNLPRTLVTMRWRAVKESSLWAGSMFQVPGVRSFRLAISEVLLRFADQ